MEKIDFQQRLVCAAVPAAVARAIEDLNHAERPYTNDELAEAAADIAVKIAAATFKKCEKAAGTASTVKAKLLALVHEGCRDSKPLDKCAVAHLDRMAANACESARLVLAQEGR